MSEMPKFFANGGRVESSPFKDEAKLSRVDIVHLRPAYHLSKFVRQQVCLPCTDFATAGSAGKDAVGEDEVNTRWVRGRE